MDRDKGLVASELLDFTFFMYGNRGDTDDAIAAPPERAWRVPVGEAGTEFDRGRPKIFSHDLRRIKTEDELKGGGVVPWQGTTDLTESPSLVVVADALLLLVALADVHGVEDGDSCAEVAFPSPSPFMASLAAAQGSDCGDMGLKSFSWAGLICGVTIDLSVSEQRSRCGSFEGTDSSFDSIGDGDLDEK